MPDERTAAEWAQRLGIPLLAAKVLVSRGWAENEAAALFRPADEAELEEPLRMKGMPEAADRIRRAISEGERIRVYGDYDADGVTSTALMIRLLTQLGADFDTYIPHRSLEGYGLNLKAVDLAAEAGVKLIVTVDNGISAVEQIAYARERGIDVVVTDHHEPPALLPEAAALVNPKQPGCPYPFKGLCGAGVAFKLAHALLGRPAAEFADLAAIGTVADLMPLVGENRLIVRMGLERMRRQPSPGIRALAEVCGTKPGELSAGRIGFGLAPRLNAGGRLERADDAVRLLTTEDGAEAERLAGKLERLNAERQKQVDATLQEAERMWQEKKNRQGGDGPGVILLSAPGWNAGIAGLVASKLVERHYRPAVILAEEPESGTCKGSARSIDGFDLYEALTECADCMHHFGGHTAAAGMTLEISRAGELEEKLGRIARERLRPEDWIPKKKADLVCSLEETTLEAADALSRLEPFGNGHPTPRLLLQGVTVRDIRMLGKEGRHVRVTVGQEERVLEAVGFGIGELADRMCEGRKLDLLGELTVNEWQGKRRVQFNIVDVKCDETLWADHRNEPDVWSAVARQTAAGTGGMHLVCASPHAAAEAASRNELRGAVIGTYADADPAGGARSETAAGAEAGVSEAGRAESRRLIVLDLPDNEPDRQTFARLLTSGGGWDSVHLFRTRKLPQLPEMPDRNRFAQVYALFREQGSWIDGPEGFLRRAADITGLPLSSVRVIQEVFEELGFIRASGAERTMVSDPPRRKLEESERYCRMVRQADAASFPNWPLDRLRAWAASAPN